jgi:sodium-coupled neutral amino acid transporter 11
MFGKNSRKDRTVPSDGESRQPLLSGSPEDSVQDESVIFAIDDDDEPNSVHSVRGSPRADRPEHSVRFREEVQVIGPPMKSTIQSREAGEHSRTQHRVPSDAFAQNSTLIPTT